MAGDMVVDNGDGTCDAPYVFVDNGNGLFSVEGILSGDDSQGSCSNQKILQKMQY